MQIIILAGGKGTRLHPITYDIPKPMVLINNQPFLEYIILYIKSLGFKNILLLVSYLGNQIKDYFKTGKDWNLNIDYSFEKEPMGTGGALKIAEDKLEDEFLLLNGDTYLQVDYNNMFNVFKQNNKLGLIALYENKDNICHNNILIDNSKLVLTYNKKDNAKMTHVDAGAIILKKEILNLIPGNKKCSLEEEIFPVLIKNQELKAFISKQRFYDMGTFERLKIVKEVLK